MKSMIGLFGRSDDHKIKKSPSAKPLSTHQLRFNIIILKREIRGLTSKLEHIKTTNLVE